MYVLPTSVMSNPSPPSLPPSYGYKRATIRGHILLCTRVVFFIYGQEYVRPFYVPHKTMMTLFCMWLKRDCPELTNHTQQCE